MITTLALANVVSGATKMGCGADRNVATKEKACELLLASEVNNDYEDCWRRLCAPEYFSESEIMLAKAAVFRHGVHGLVINPYNELDHHRPANQLETEYADHLKQSSQVSMDMDL